MPSLYRKMMSELYELMPPGENLIVSVHDAPVLRLPKKKRSLLCEPKEMKFAAIDEYRHAYPLRLMCRAFSVSLSGYHAWRKRPASLRNQEEWRLVRLIEKIHQGSRGTYGSPRSL